MQISGEGYDIPAIVNHVYELPTSFEKREYLTKKIEVIIKLMTKCKEENPGLYNPPFIDILAQAKGILSLKKQFQADIDHLRFVLDKLPENENPTDTKQQNNTLSFPKETLYGIFNTDAIDKFIEIENRLIGDNYFNEERKWIKSLDECAALISKLSANKYLLPKKKKIWITKVCKPFFEGRYKIKFSKQLQPQYRKASKLSSFFNWIEILK